VPHLPSSKPSANNYGVAEEEIVIHVFDENRKMNKDFKCEKNLLLSQMKYFE
jgi:Domain of unknown function (DUF3342)